MRRYILSTFVLVVLAARVHAHVPPPRLNSIFPLGAQQGTTVECVITGGDLDGVNGLHFSHPGITAQPVGGNKFKVSVAKDVPVGPYDVRAITPAGISNFRAFVVGDCVEAIEKEPNNELERAQRVTLPVVVNGRIDSGADVDHYIFAAKKGQRVFIDCRAWRHDSPLDATLMLFDGKGKELAYSGDYYGRDPFIDFTAPEDGDYIVKVWDFVYSGGADYVYRLHIDSLPHIDAVMPAAVPPGKKTTVTIYGRNLPGGKPAPAGFEIQGRPLEMLSHEVEAPADPVQALGLRGGEAIRPGQASLDGMPFRLHTPEGSSNPIFLAFTTDPILVEQEPNNDRKTAQKVPVPCDVTGMLHPRGDLDHYTFSAKKGEKLVVEVFGERQSGLPDPFLSGFDAAGKKLFSDDDAKGNIGQLRFPTMTRDVRWNFNVPADGEYTAQVRDLYYQQRGDPRFVYRLSIRRVQPDFRLVAVPAHEVQPDATVIPRGGRHRIDVLAFRQDGFDGPITVEAADLPAGVTCDPVIIAPGKASVPLILHAAPNAPIGQNTIRIVGKAKPGDAEVVRIARAGGMVWPTVNTPGIARLADGVVVAVREAAPFALTAVPEKTSVPAGGKVRLTVQLARNADWTESVQLQGFDLPPNVTVGLVTVGKDATEAKVELTVPANVMPGTYSFVINGAGQASRDYLRPRDPAKPRGANLRVVYPSNAVTLTITADEKPAK